LNQVREMPNRSNAFGWLLLSPLILLVLAFLLSGLPFSPFHG
jgi:hypothetical protein